MPSAASLFDLHNVIQAAMGWQNYHLHLFAKDWVEYGDNHTSEYDVTLAGLLPEPGQWLAYRYDFGDCWDHDLVVEKIHQPGAKALYPRCSAGGRACPPEDSGGPEGFAELLRVLRHKKGWKYRQARNILGAGRWNGAAWDRQEVNDQLAQLGTQWANMARDRVADDWCGGRGDSLLALLRGVGVDRVRTKILAELDEGSLDAVPDVVARPWRGRVLCTLVMVCHAPPVRSWRPIGSIPSQIALPGRMRRCAGRRTRVARDHMAWLGCDAGACDAEMIAPSKRITAPVGVREITPTANLVHLARSYLAARRGPEVLTLPDRARE